MSLPAESSPRSRTWPANLNDTSVSTIALPSPSSGPTATPLTASALIPFHMLQATSQQLTHLMLLEPALDIAFQFSHAASQHDDVFAGVVYLEPIGFALMASD